MSIRQIDYRVDVLRGGVPIGRLAFSSPPSIFCSADDETPLTLQGQFRRGDMDVMRDELQPVMLLNGVEYPLGVYRIGTMSSRRNEAQVMYDNVTAYDRTILLRWAKLEHRAYWAAGTRYADVISSYLTAAGITMAIMEPTDAVLATDREDWDVGTPYLEIINQLLSEINFRSLWFDLTGAARVQAYVPPGPENLQHTYREGDVVKVLGPAYGTRLDVFDAPNVFIAILENPEYPEPLVATAVNDSPGSKISTINRGVRIPEIVKVDNIANAAALQEYVNRVRDEGMRTSEYVDIETVNLGTHGVGDVIGLQLQDLQGIFRETSWSLTMQGGAMMQHRLERVVVI